MWIYDNHSSYKLINVSRSLANRRTEVDSVIPYKYREHYLFPFINTHISNPDIIAGIQSMKLFESEGYKPKYYTLFRNDINHPVHEFTLYKKPIPAPLNNPQIGMGDHYDSFDVIHPKGTKVALAMCMVGQINILDIAANRLTGYHLENTPTLEEAAGQTEYTAYFTQIAADERFIYALTAKRVPALANTVLVMDWNGNPIRKLILDKSLLSFALDPQGNTLCGIDLEDNVYIYTLPPV